MGIFFAKLMHKVEEILMCDLKNIAFLQINTLKCLSHFYKSPDILGNEKEMTARARSTIVLTSK